MASKRHGSTVEAAETVDAAERSRFDAEAKQRYARIVASGMTLAWADMRK